MAPASQPLSRKRRGAKAVKPLKALCVQALSSHIESVDTLGLAPDWALVEIFRNTILSGKLSPRVLELFKRTGDELVLDFIEKLDIKDTAHPVLYSNACKDGVRRW